MSIVFEKGDLFSVEADVIAHGCNCQGVMGAGIAKAFAAKFPSMYREYSKECYIGTYVPGDFMPWHENDVMGVNLFTQENPGADATYEAVVVSLIGVSQRIKRAYALHPVIFAMPLIGCGIGGLHFIDLHRALTVTNNLFEGIMYKVVYNDDNEHLIPAAFRVDSTP